ncbi:PAS domain S-box protein [Anaerolineae bacterium CFX9]|nr:PAS domain S-box protein [Anaerolineae bacterium CFX9]
MLTLLDYRVRQRDFLLDILRAITAQLDLAEVLKLVLNASNVMLGGQAGIIALRDPLTEEYRIRAILGIETSAVPGLQKQVNDLIASFDETQTYDDVEHKLDAIASALDPRFRKAFAIPLAIAGEALGVLIVFRTYRGSATIDDIQVLQSFADQASIAVQNAQLYQRIDQERRRLGAILQHSADGIMILDANEKIVGFNRQLEKMTGWTAQDAIGLHQDEVITWKRLEKGDFKLAVEDGWPFRRPADAPEETLYVEGDLQRRDGMSLSIGIRYAPLISAEGELTNIIANIRDITNFRQAQEMQNVFISTISHELKTPVALIKGYAATLRRDDVEFEAPLIREYSGVIEEEADRLTGLIENLLTASRLQAERTLRLSMGDIHLDELAERAVERYRTQSQIHRFSTHFPPQFPTISGDEVKLRQVLDNLLSNAVKYSPEGGKIEVGGSFTDTHVTLYVRDEGVGMSEADREHLFERFYRVDNALSRKTQGTGLGLYLSKAIIEAHGGTLTVESAIGKGSTFFVTLPLN